jgi:hypothetical protein
MLEFSWQAQMDSRSLLTCRLRIKKNGREITKLAERFISLSSLLPVVCFLRNRSVFIMIARDSLSFGFSCFCFVTKWKRDIISRSCLDVLKM